MLNITSGRALHMIHAAARNGFQSVDKDELVNNSEFSRPGDLFRLYPFGMIKLAPNSQPANCRKANTSHSTGKPTGTKA